MDNLPEDILQALHRYADGQATAEEIRAVDAWISGLDFSEELSPEIESELDKIYSRAHERLMTVVHAEDERRAKRRTLRPLFTYVKIAASVVGVIALGAGAYLALQSKSNQNGTIAQASAVVPGGKKAILELADGRKIDLNTVPVGGEMAQEGDAIIRKTADGQVIYQIGQPVANDHKSAGYLGQMNTITIPNGGEYSLTLSDGTRIWMNAASRLRFPSEFGKGSRIVELLQGEAYFEVAKDATKPFHVIVTKDARPAGAMNVEVLGTAFNIRAYDAATEIKTTLVSGSVRISSANNAQTTVLEPGFQSIMNAANNIEVARIDTIVAIGWIRGDFYFDNTPVPQVMDELARWYNVKVEYKTPVDSRKTVTAKWDHSEKLDKILQELTFIGVKTEYSADKKSIIVL